MTIPGWLHSMTSGARRLDTLSTGEKKNGATALKSQICVGKMTKEKKIIAMTNKPKWLIMKFSANSLHVAENRIQKY